MDDADIADRNTEHTLTSAIRRAAQPVPPGSPGDCEFCGEWSGRLVGGACARCRDRYKLDNKGPKR